MKTIRYEFIKIFSNKLFVVLFLSFIFANAISINYYQSNDLETKVFHNNNIEYEDIISKVSTLSNEDANLAIQKMIKVNEIALLIDRESENDDLDINNSLYNYKTNSPKEYLEAQEIHLSREALLNRQTLLEDLINQVNYINDYDIFIENMDQRAEKQLRFSIFGEQHSFSNENISKTANDFKQLKGIKLKIGNNSFVDNSTTFVLTDLFVFTTVFLLCIYVFTFERDKMLYILIRTTKNGNMKLIVSKLVVVILLTMVLGLAFYTSNIVITGMYSGFGDLSRNIQSLRSFMNCNLKLQIWQYLVLWICSKIVTMCAVSAILSLICVCIKNSSLIITVTFIIILTECILYFSINPYASYNQLKYINFIYFLSGNNLIGNYHNIEIFSSPVNITKIYIVLIPVIFVGLSIVICCSFMNQKQLTSRSLIDSLINRISMLFGRLSDGTSLFRGECFKHYKGSMAILAIIILAFVAYSNLNDDISVVYSSAQESAYSSYLNDLEGPFTQDKEKYLSEQQQYFDGLNQKIDNILSNSYLSNEEKEMKTTAIQSILETKGAAFNEVLEQSDYIKAKGEELEIQPQFINKTIYKRLTENPQREWYLFFLLMIVVIFTSSNVFAYEHKKQMTNLIRCNRNGKIKLVITKIAVSLITTLASFVLVYLPYYINFIKTFGTVSFDSPIVFIQDFSGVDSSISIYETLFLISIVHFFFATMVAMLVMMFSQIFKNNIISMIVSSVLILFPCILCMNISEIRLYTAFQKGIWMIIVPTMLIFSIMVFILCFLVAYISFSKEKIKLFGRIKNVYA